MRPSIKDSHEHKYKTKITINGNQIQIKRKCVGVYNIPDGENKECNRVETELFKYKEFKRKDSNIDEEEKISDKKYENKIKNIYGKGAGFSNIQLDNKKHAGIKISGDRIIIEDVSIKNKINITYEFDSKSVNRH